MAESLVAVTSGSGKNLHTFNRTIGANSVEDEVMLQGLPYLPTYTIPIALISTATGGSHVLAINAGSSLNVYILSVILWQSTAATTAAFCEWSFRRTTTAPSGGTAANPVPLDQGDPAAGVTGLTLPTKGTEGAVIYRANSYMTQTPGAAGVPQVPVVNWNWSDAGPLAKPIRLGAGTTTGLGIRNDTAVAAATVTGTVTLVEANF